MIKPPSRDSRQRLLRNTARKAGAPRLEPIAPPHLDHTVVPPTYRADPHRWTCSAGCKITPKNRSAVYKMEAIYVEYLYVPVHDADLAPSYATAVKRRSPDSRNDPSPQFPVLRIAAGPLCALCGGPMVREGLCLICQHRAHLEHFVPPPDFEPGVDRVDRVNTCQGCFIKLDPFEPPPEPPPEPPRGLISAESYEDHIRAARGRSGLRRALIKAARRDHPDDPRWAEFEPDLHNPNRTPIRAPYRSLD